MDRLCNIVTCGDVDSGKSTLFGRLLYNTNNIYEDQLADIENASKKYSAYNRFEYGLLFDGLLEERKQQITIDTAHRYFHLAGVRFHLLDCPGHPQYTHNFVISAAIADIAVLVVDSTKGLMPQTLVHYDICKTFKIKKVIIAITKTDLVELDKLNELENKIKAKTEDCIIVKTSAIENTNMDSFEQTLYKCATEITDDNSNFALCVQAVKRQEDRRLIQGISYGKLDKSKDVVVFPSNIVCQITKAENETYCLDREVDISRGFIITDLRLERSDALEGSFIKFKSDFSNTDLIFKYGTSVSKIKSVNKNRLELYENIYHSNIETFKDLGYGLVIDNKTKLNVGVFIISGKNKNISQNHCYWFTGFSGSGKTTLAKKFIQNFAVKPIMLDGDDIRRTINYDLTISDEDRDTNVKKIANLANLFIEQGFNVIVSCISKDLRQREYAKNLLKGAYVEIFIEADEETRKSRDTKGLYKHNIKPLNNYEKSPWEYFTINTNNATVDKSYTELLEKLDNKGLI